MSGTMQHVALAARPKGAPQPADFLAEVGPLVHNGRIPCRKTVAEGLAAAPAAFIVLIEGRNFGKQLVRVAVPA